MSVGAASGRRGNSAAAPASPRTSLAEDSRHIGLSVLLILAAGILVYLNSFRGVLIYDDMRFIVENENIRKLWPIWQHFTRAYRPIVEASLATNYAIGELRVWGYHAFNLTVHLLAALALFGIVRRTLLLDGLRACFGRSAKWLACSVSLIWLVHPLQTESVTYIIQRAESMASLFYLLTLYCVLRGAGPRKSKWWYVLAVAACGLGMGSKAIVVTAPALVLIYDGTMLSGTASKALRRRWPLYLGLAATWAAPSFTWIVPRMRGVLGSVFGTASKDVAYGFGFKGVTPVEYVLTQAGVIVHYLKLSFWPHGLCLDYKWQVEESLSGAIAPGMFVLALLALTAWALWRKPRLGFLGACFFVLLAPTSSFIPMRNVAVEHRMYLPLAAVVVLVVLASRAFLKYILDLLAWTPRSQKVIAVGLVFVVVALLSSRTVDRNRDYHSAVAMWKSVAAQRPHNFRAINNVGFALDQEGNRDEAIEWFRRSLEVNPRYYWAHYNLGVNLARKGETAQAIKHYKKALRTKAKLAKAHRNVALLLKKHGRIEEAIEHARDLLRLKPNSDSHFLLANALLAIRRYEEAIEHYHEALRLKPRRVGTHVNLGMAYERLGSIDLAIEHFRQATQIAPDLAVAQRSLARALKKQAELE